MKVGMATKDSATLEAVHRARLKGHAPAWVEATAARALSRARDEPTTVLVLDAALLPADPARNARLLATAPCPVVLLVDAIVSPACSPVAAVIDRRVCLASAEGLAGALRDALAAVAPRRGPDHLLCIGSSCGGPVALAEVLGHLPRGASGSVLVAQHMDPRFVSRFATWLAGQIPWTVAVARAAAAPQAGIVTIASGEDDLVLLPAQVLGQVPASPRSVYRPSIDALLHSVAAHWRRRATGVLLTGMGKDGAAGLLAMRRAGHRTIAQDEGSAVAAGMPRAAAALGAAGEVLPLHAIGPALARR